MNRDRSEALGLFVLRFGCAWFIFVWAANKVFATKQYQDLARWIDKVEISETQILVLAAVQIAVCLLVFAGAFRTWSYAALALMHGYTVYRQWPQYLDPFEVNADGFPVNRNVTVSLCALFAMIAMWLLRRRDVWSLDGWREGLGAGPLSEPSRASQVRR
jgi:hypothetical protein